MKSRLPEHAETDQLFHALLDQTINMNHELIALADRIDWCYLDSKMELLYVSIERPSTASRLMVGPHLLK